MEQALAVDVLVIGAGIPALSIAHELHHRYAVCVVSDPEQPSESYDGPARFGAGYTGNDVERMRAAREAAIRWRRWAGRAGVPCEAAPVVHVMRPGAAGVTTRRWYDAGLTYDRILLADRPLGDGAAASQATFATPDSTVMDPGLVAGALRAGLEDRIVAARVERFGMITEQAVDVVELDVAGAGTVSVLPRFVVLAADAANSSLLQRLALAFKDRTRRRRAVEAARTCQAVRRRPTVAVRGDLPPVSVHVDGLDVTSLPTGYGRGDVVWLMQLPVDDSDTVVGAEDVRFDPPLNGKVVGEGLDWLFELCPELHRRNKFLRWAAWTARETTSSIAASSEPDAATRPIPARIETLGMDAALAAWPSDLTFAGTVAAVVAERVGHALGDPLPPEGPEPASFARPAPESTQVRWLRPDHTWFGWGPFAAQIGYGRAN